MKRIVLCALTLTLAGFAVAQTPDAQDDEAVRGAFLTSRPKEQPKASSTATRPSHRRPKPVATTGPNKPATNSTSGQGKTDSKKNAATRIGLGLTLFMRDANGLAVRVDPSHAFHKGDRVRVLLETNADGYLYIFNATDTGPAVMLFPDPDLDQAGSYIRSHEPFEIPSSLAAEERLRWFVFDEYAGTEHLYFVFTREPLDGVPIEDNLIGYCSEGKKCPWQPDAEVWQRIQNEMTVPVQSVKAQKFGKAETEGEHNAVTRGLGLSKDDAEPSLIMLSASSVTNILVTSIDLLHK